MKSYCLKCKTKTDDGKSVTVRTKNNRLIKKTKCSICSINKCKFVSQK